MARLPAGRRASAARLYDLTELIDAVRLHVERGRDLPDHTQQRPGAPSFDQIDRARRNIRLAGKLTDREQAVDPGFA